MKKYKEDWEFEQKSKDYFDSTELKSARNGLSRLFPYITDEESWLIELSTEHSDKYMVSFYYVNGDKRLNLYYDVLSAIWYPSDGDTQSIIDHAEDRSGLELDEVLLDWLDFFFMQRLGLYENAENTYESSYSNEELIEKIKLNNYQYIIYEEG